MSPLAELCELALRQVSERSSRSNDRTQAGANFRSWPQAASWDGFQIADIRNPLILPTTAFWRHA